MISTNDAQTLMNGGGSVVSADGTTIGDIGVISLDAVSGDPAWVTATGRVDDRGQPVAPLVAASVIGADVVVAFDRQQIADAPHIDDGGRLTPSDEQALSDYYGLGARGPSGPASSAARDGQSRADGSGVMVRSEEELRVGTETVVSGRVRVRKYIVTEEVTLTVQVSREEVRLESEPIADLEGSALEVGAAVHEQSLVELTLHAQRPVVTMETVPVERITVSTAVVTEQVQVIDQVRKEQIDAERAETGGVAEQA